MLLQDDADIDHDPDVDDSDQFAIITNCPNRCHKSNLCRVEMALRSAGFWVRSYLTNSRWFGLPQNRRRWYILAIRSHIFESVGMTFAEADALSDQYVELSMRNRAPVKQEDIILPENDALIQKHWADLEKLRLDKLPPVAVENPAPTGCCAFDAAPSVAVENPAPTGCCAFDAAPSQRPTAPVTVTDTLIDGVDTIDEGREDLFPDNQQALYDDSFVPPECDAALPFECDAAVRKAEESEEGEDDHEPLPPGLLSEWLAEQIPDDELPSMELLPQSALNEIQKIAKKVMKNKNFLNWQREHKQAYRLAGHQWPPEPSLEDACRLHPGLRQIGQREWEVLIYFSCHRRQPGNLKWLDVSQRLLRTPHPEHSCVVPCVTPNALFVIPDRMRVALGYEKLLAQGIRYGRARDQIIRSQSNGTLSSLGGNAFAIPVCAGMMFALHGVRAAAAEVGRTGLLLYPHGRHGASSANANGSACGNAAPAKNAKRRRFLDVSSDEA